jgi:hypothetical protein
MQHGKADMGKSLYKIFSIYLTLFSLPKYFMHYDKSNDI